MQAPGIVAKASAVFVGMMLLTIHAQADDRVALVIGNSAYQNVAHLRNPASDAALIASALKQDGFSVTLTQDLDYDSLIKVLRAFGKEADVADWAVVYFAGHGVEIGGINYLIPIDAKLETDRDVGFEAVPIEQVMSAIDGAHTLRMVILDACRSNPFLPAMKRSSGTGRDIGRGLSIVEPQQATLVAYSAKAGTIAADGDGTNSPFAIALAQHLAEPGVEVDKMFRLVRDDVLEATAQAQEPFVYGSLPGRQDFYFRPAASASPSQSLPQTTIVEPSSNAEVVFWQSIQNSPRSTDFEAYLEKFPSGMFAPLARTRLAALNPSPAPAETDVLNPAASDQSARAQEAATAFEQSWSRPNADALAYLEALYPPQLSYFGKPTSKDQVMLEKSSFAARWPERLYSIEPGTMKSTCTADHLCEVQGVVDWNVYSSARDTTSTGSADFDLTFAMTDPLRLLSEASTVLTRRSQKGRLAATTLPTRVGQCMTKTITEIGNRLVDSVSGKAVEGSGSAVSYANGGYQVSYDQVPEIDGSRPGDSVNLCLVSVPTGCPPGDDRGRVYRATNLRTRMTWEAPDAEHECGGA